MLASAGTTVNNTSPPVGRTPELPLCCTDGLLAQTPRQPVLSLVQVSGVGPSGRAFVEAQKTK